jgi:intraflagellar transport protein 46
LRSHRPPSPKSRYSDLDPENEPPRRANSPRDRAWADSTADLTKLFSLVNAFIPEPVELQVHWKPFLPDLVPAIGTIDAFIKIPRPDEKIDELGLFVLDEPSISQSNPQILRMELREQYGLTSPDNQCTAYIGCIEDPQKDHKALSSWLDSLEEIHRNRPPPAVIYSSKMPEMESLMEPWTDKFEEVLRALVLPGDDLDLTFDEYARVICSILDIPVRGNIIESLHCLFSLYSQFEGNLYFQSQRQRTPQ